MINVLIAPDSFKGTLSARHAANIISSSFCNSTLFNCKIKPLAHGGEGSLELISIALDVQKINLTAFAPNGKIIETYYLRQNTTAYIEVANISGITLIEPDERKPLHLNSYGTGQLIKHAIENGCSTVHLLLGGSATVDGGLGIVQAINNVPFVKQNALLDFKSVELDTFKKAIHGICFIIVCDVDNLIVGEQGAAKVFGPQKAASAEEVIILEQSMQNVLSEVEKITEIDLRKVHGLGAAGGMAMPIVALGSESNFISGFDYFNALLDYYSAIKNADVVITGEGCIDEQTSMGKGPGQIAEMAKQNKKLVCGIGGVVKCHPTNFDMVMATTDDQLTEYELKNNAEVRLKQTADILVKKLSNLLL